MIMMIALSSIALGIRDPVNDDAQINVVSKTIFNNLNEFIQ